MQEIRIRTDEKEGLHNEERRSGLDVWYLIVVYIGLLAVLLICVPKIWLSNSIYYISRDINKLQTQSDLLKEENKRLQNEREILRYQYLNTQINTH